MMMMMIIMMMIKVPIEVTLVGIVIEFNPVHDKKATTPT